MFTIPRDYIDQLTAAYGSSNETPYSRLGVAWTVATTSGSNYGTLMYNFLYGDDATDAGFTQATVPGNSRNPTLAIALDTASSTMRALLLYEQEGSTDIQGTWVPDAYANGTTEAYTPFGLAETNPYLIYNTKTDKFTYVTQVGGNLRMATNAVSSAAAALPYNVAAALDFDDANDPSGPARLGFVPSTGKMVAVWPSANKVYFDAEAFTPTAVNPVSSGDVAVKLYPNPATDQLHISCTAQAATEATFRLTDVTGRTVLAQEVKLAAGLNEVSLKLPALPAASYTATLRGEAVNFSAQLLVR